MAEYELDVRELPRPKRHPVIMKAFNEVESGGTLKLVNDHEPKPIYRQMSQELEEFDEESYEVEQKELDKFVARFPKK